MRELTFAFSPCPNDTFAFHALVHGLVPAAVEVKPVLLDIEELNNRAHRGSYEVTKMSFGAFPALALDYRLLRSGAALGFGSGPLVVAREAMSLAEAAAARIAIPGYATTAFLLLRLATPALGEVVELRYDRVVDAVVGGRVDAGLIIHESRFTYRDRGLIAVADLGEWWERETALPVPLAGIFAKQDLDEQTVIAVEHAVRSSVEYALARPDASRHYVREHAQMLSDEVCDAHIRLYVTDLTVDLGEKGLRAIEALLGRARLPAGTS